MSPAAATTEAHVPGARALQQDKPLQWEACSPQPESSSCSLQLEEAQEAMKTQHSKK